MRCKNLICLVVAIAVVFSIGLTSAAAADYPKRPITLICPWGAGGGTDAVSRIIATLLKKDLGVPVNVVNRTGGSGAVGHTAMATAKPDGYTIGMPTVEITMMHWMGLTKITYQDMTPVAMVNFDPAGINVRTDSPWKTYKDLEMYVRDNPGKLKDSGTGQGGDLASGHGRMDERHRVIAQGHKMDSEQRCCAGLAGSNGRRHRDEHLFAPRGCDPDRRRQGQTPGDHGFPKRPELS